MQRVIVEIDEARCDGCGECVPSCAEGAIRVVEREAVAFDEEAVARHLAPPPRRSLSVVQATRGAPSGGCPGARSVDLGTPPPARPGPGPAGASQLSHWPIQLGLVSPNASWLAGADLLLAADCVPFAYADFHRDLLAGRRVLVGCPKLDDLQASVGRLTELFRSARPRSVTVAKMEVPCCGGIARAAREAVRLSGVDVPLLEVTIGVRGERLPLWRSARPVRMG